MIYLHRCINQAFFDISRFDVFLITDILGERKAGNIAFGLGVDVQFDCTFKPSPAKLIIGVINSPESTSNIKMKALRLI